MTALPRNTILLGEAQDRLRELPSDSVDCVVTSPPYFAARDYGHPQQIGHESTVAGWVSQMRTVFAEVARVLKPTGALWLNLGDGYARRASEGATPKSLLLGPERVALALVADGWILRNKIVWAKPNPMPSSVRDRLSCTYEVVYFFTRVRRYVFDLDAIRVPLRTTQRRRTSDPERRYPPAGTGAPIRPGRAANPNSGLSSLRSAGRAGHPLGKNPGDVWTLPTAAYRGAHFATFPFGLVERPLLATCPATVCQNCGASAAGGCGCAAGTRPGIVLDPFFGAGTVGVAAEHYGRDWLGIELNPAYVALATARMDKARSLRVTPASRHKHTSNKRR